MAVEPGKVTGTPSEPPSGETPPDGPPSGQPPSGQPPSGGPSSASPVEPPPAPEAPAPEASSPEKTKPRRRDRWFRYTVPGLWGALLFACLAYTPSLLPRSGFLQGAVTGISAAIGYGLGVTAAWVWRAFANRDDARPARRRSWQILVVVAVVALLTFLFLGRHWQNEVRAKMGMPPDTLAALVIGPVVAAVLFVAFVALGRVLRKAYRGAARLLGRWIGPRAARAVGWVLVVGGTILLVNGVLLDGLVNVANETFSVRNDITPEGVVQPTSPLRSGSPNSLVPWDSLGREGRKFVALGPTSDQISAFTGRPAMYPIRAFGGLLSADDAEARAQLAVADLERAGGFDRGTLVVATTTGSGWVDPASIDTIEYMTDGDVATIAMQYSYLPSWISYLVDQQKAREAGRELFDAVYDRWSKMDQATRPRLVVFGESLGSFGGETAFSGEYDLRNRTSGAVYAGPPNFNVLYREFTDHRDTGSPEREPVYKDGRTVRFTDNPEAGVGPEGQPWDGTRVLYIQHASDPIVWWSPHLILRRPDWLRESPGPDVLSAVRWMPFITFWQVTADLPFATGVPAGHGHVYTGEYVDAWADVLQPTGWTPAQTDQLRGIILKGG